MSANTIDVKAKASRQVDEKEGKDTAKENEDELQQNVIRKRRIKKKKKATQKQSMSKSYRYPLDTSNGGSSNDRRGSVAMTSFTKKERTNLTGSTASGEDKGSVVALMLMGFVVLRVN